MQAIVYQRYGSPDVLEFDEIPIPAPSEGKVLIRVHAASVNQYDWHFLRGTPSFIRLFTGMWRPKFPRLGADVAVVVEAVGTDAAPFKPGDAVFGTAKGSFAEYACAVASQLALKPQEISFEQAACLPIAGVTALQGLRDKGKVQTGQTVLINGAAGGVGTFAVQIAKSLGLRAVHPRGTYISCGGGGPDRSTRNMLAAMVQNAVRSAFTSQKMPACSPKSIVRIWQFSPA